MTKDWENHLAAFNLAEAGRWEDALRVSASTGDLCDVLSQRAFRAKTTEDPIILGWQFYYLGHYREALAHFLVYELAAQDGEVVGWRRAWCQLGIAKIASDSGHWKTALKWCSSAWKCAAEREHLDLMAQISGARGEVLLRAGRPLDAAAAFAEDRALLTPGNRFHGRLRCYEAHAWSRMGKNGRIAAALAYRIALHSSGEEANAAYAAAGLALLNIRMDCFSIHQAEWNAAAKGLPLFWVLIAKVKAGADKLLLQRAFDALPQIHYAEHWWLANWSRSLGYDSFLPPDLAEIFPSTLPNPPEQVMTGVESPVMLTEFADAPWWSDGLQDNDTDWWQLRDCFMP